MREEASFLLFSVVNLHFLFIRSLVRSVLLFSDNLTYILAPEAAAAARHASVAAARSPFEITRAPRACFGSKPIAVSCRSGSRVSPISPGAPSTPAVSPPPLPPPPIPSRAAARATSSREASPCRSKSGDQGSGGVQEEGEEEVEGGAAAAPPAAAAASTLPSSFAAAALSTAFLSTSKSNAKFDRGTAAASAVGEESAVGIMTWHRQEGKGRRRRSSGRVFFLNDR